MPAPGRRIMYASSIYSMRVNCRRRRGDAGPLIKLSFRGSSHGNDGRRQTTDDNDSCQPLVVVNNNNNNNNSSDQRRRNADTG